MKSSRLPPAVALCLDAALTIAQVAAFVAILWGVWFIAWVLG